MLLRKIINGLVILLAISGIILVFSRDFGNGVLSIIVATALRVFREQLININRNK
jgi:hypothetical protein